MDTLKSGQPPYNGQTVCLLPTTVYMLPKKGQPPNNGQNVRPQRVHCSEVQLYHSCMLFNLSNEDTPHQWGHFLHAISYWMACFNRSHIHLPLKVFLVALTDGVLRFSDIVPSIATTSGYVSSLYHYWAAQNTVRVRTLHTKKNTDLYPFHKDGGTTVEPFYIF